MVRAVLAVSLVLLAATMAGCVMSGGGSRSGDLVRIVEFTIDGNAFDDVNDASDVLAAIADTRFEYTHTTDSVAADDITVEYTDESGLERKAPLSDFTTQDTVGKGDRITITGALLTSAVKIRAGSDTLASRGGDSQEWLQAGGYPLPLAMHGGLAVWDLGGGLRLDAGLDHLEMVQDTGAWCAGEPSCESYQETTRFTDGIIDGDADLNGELSLTSLGTMFNPSLEFGLDGEWTTGAEANVHVVEESTDPNATSTDADFGFELDLTAQGQGKLRFGFDRNGGLETAGTEGDLDVFGDLVIWDDTHPRSEEYSPADFDDFDVHSSYGEDEVPLGDNAADFVVQALQDLWRMDLAPGDEFHASTGDRFGEGAPSAELTIRVVDETRKRVAAGTFDAVRVETTTAVQVPFEGSTETFDLPMLTTWIDLDSGVPIAIEETLAYDYDEADFAPIFAFLEDMDEGLSITPPDDLHIKLAGSPVAELTDWKDGFHMAPMASVLLPLLSVAGPMVGFLFPFGAPFGGFSDESYADEPYPEQPKMAPPPAMEFGPATTTGPGGTIPVARTEPGVLWSDLMLSGGNCLKPQLQPDVRSGDVIVCSQDGLVSITHLPTQALLYQTML